MRCQHVDDDIQCRFDATRRVFVGCGDPPDPDQAGFAGTIYMVQVCREHDPDPRQSMPLPRPPGSEQLEQQLRQRLDDLGPAPRAELLHVLMLPDLERVDRIGEFWRGGSRSNPEGRCEWLPLPASPAASPRW